MPFKKLIKKLLRSSKADQPGPSTEPMHIDEDSSFAESSESDTDYDPEKTKKSEDSAQKKKYRKHKPDESHPERQQAYRKRHPESDESHPERQQAYRRRHPESDESHPERQQAYRRRHPESDESHPERQQTYRRRHPETHSHADRQARSYRRIRSSERNPEPSSDFDFTIKEHPELHFLGERNNVCEWCGALHFSGFHSCCNRGRVFIEPFKKFPEPLYSLYSEIYSTAHNKFLNNIIGYNNLFSFASINYNKITVAPFGVQSVKAEGPIRHFPSAIRPNNENYPHYGNFYIYDARKATEARIKSQYYHKGMDETVVLSIGDIMARVNPFARLYRTMNEMMKSEEARTGSEAIEMRLKIVDPYEYQSQEKELQAHPGVYGTGNYGDYICVFYSCNIEQQIRTRGLTIYPKLGRGVIPRPIFCWMKEVNALCYPLVFPYGELGWSWKGHKLMITTKRYKGRLEEYLADHPEARPYMDNELLAYVSPDYIYTQSRRDPNMESEYESPLEDEQEDENLIDQEYDNQLVQNVRECQSREELATFVTTEERDGEEYPVRRPYSQLQRRVNEPDSDDIETDNEDEEQSVTEQNNEQINMDSQNRTAAELHSNSDNEPEELLDNSAETQENDYGDQESISERQRKRIYVSQREWILYVAQDRITDRNQVNRISTTGRLGQVFLIDQCLRILKNRYDEIERHHTQYKTSTKKKLLEALQRVADRFDRQVGCITSIPVSVPGSPRFLQRKFEDAVAMANTLGPPDLFITFTANMNWKEITDNIPRGYTWADFPVMVNEVFKKKFDEFMVIMQGKKVRVGGCMRHRGGIFGKIRYFFFSTEYQSRGPPHVHAIFSLENHIKTTQQIDAICKAELPTLDECEDEEDFEWKSRLRANVEGLMIHRPCEFDNQAYCRKGTKAHWSRCQKDFPKDYCDHTQFGDRHYPLLMRRNNGEFVEKTSTNGTVRATNRHVVSFNEFLLNKFGSHINIEIISSLKQVKYIFKYLFKGFDRALIECFFDNQNGAYPVTAEMSMDNHILYSNKIKYEKGSLLERNAHAIEMLRKNGINPTDEHGNPVLVFNECQQIEDMRSMTSCEAASIISGFPRYGSSHTVVTLFVHEPNNEPVRMELWENDIEEILENRKTSPFEAWFELNSFDEEAKQYTFEELPLYYIFANGRWRRRKLDWSDRVIGHIKSVHPRYMEKFGIRLLAKNRRGPTSWEDLRTVNGEVYDTCVDAAKALHLMNSQVEWVLALGEAATLENPTALRRMFGSILTDCAPENPEELWEMFKLDMYANRTGWDEITKEAHALFHLQSILQYHGMELENYGLPDVVTANLPAQRHLVNDKEQKVVSRTEAEEMAQWKFEALTLEQKQVCEEVLQSIEERKSVFMEGAGGTGKTSIYNCLYYILTARNYKVLSTAHTGVAATLLPGGSTVHRAFSVPLETEETMTCNIDLESEQAQELRKYNVVLWDESTMSDRRIVSSISYLLQAIHGNAASFGGIPVVFGGNWMQTLPIVDGVNDHDVVNYSLKRSTLWPELKFVQLRTNMRAREDPPFAEWIHDIGNGHNYVGKEQVVIPPQLLVNNEDDLVDFVFGNGVINDLQTCSKSAILTVDNKTALEINEKVLKMLDGEEREYISTDVYDPEKGFHEMDPETYNMMTPSGLPPHKLVLKVGAIVILLRNKNVHTNLCNGTKMMIVCKVLNPTKLTPDVVYLHRQAMQSTDKMRRDISFIRWQLPIRLAYALTINKAQGQTLERVGILFRTPVFQHGQLYVAVSRARCFKEIRICNLAGKNNRLTRNVVYRDILEEDDIDME